MTAWFDLPQPNAWLLHYPNVNVATEGTCVLIHQMQDGSIQWATTPMLIGG